MPLPFEGSVTALIMSGIETIMPGIPEEVGIMRDEVDTGAEYIVAPFVVSRPSTPLSLPKPTEPVIAPVAVVSYLGHA